MFKVSYPPAGPHSVSPVAHAPQTSLRRSNGALPLNGETAISSHHGILAVTHQFLPYPMQLGWISNDVEVSLPTAHGIHAKLMDMVPLGKNMR